MSRYEQLPANDFLQDEVDQEPGAVDIEEKPVQEKARKWLQILLRAITITLTIYAIVDIVFQLWMYTFVYSMSEDSACSCGDTPAEAVSRGCKFDPFAATWLPDRCRDDELIDFFNDLGHKNNHTWWDFYDWPDKNDKMDLQQISMKAGRVGIETPYVTTSVDWHHAHCLFLLAKGSREKSNADEFIAYTEVDIYPDGFEGNEEDPA
ncbi:conserved hypothetical protein [Talaromyces stipitatus ATCC 10500]|uniref:Uncharacterized protein n=1 Tax=Talaromyces stipitatus (strain ATCC 10500 / CBS 375.48 / QM 6759 / NRRL 1006) TaxID=441959 RepID=B8M4E9_TALSN|nr:uncharacterized protein TSTA_024660 [Talaromyces stipitatus ATCC 10500]EED19144.1 conserved hypothetical protein [Talaromyces stipitatus ATCC 10500]